MQVMQKIRTASCFFITSLLVFYAACLIIFKSHFYFIFEYILNYFRLLLQAFDPTRLCILAGVYTWITSQCKAQDFF